MDLNWASDGMKVFLAGWRPLSSPLALMQPQVRGWVGLSLVAPLYFGLISLHHGTAELIIQDDVRLHLVWLQRLTDPELFANDAIADYYAAIQPVGFKAFYGAVTALGIHPLVFAQVVPLLLALITTVYVFGVALLILPVPLCGLLTTLILNQNIWLKDDLISATPRAFVYGIFATFLYYLLRGARIPCLIALALQGLFYPQMMVVSTGLVTLRLIDANTCANSQIQRSRLRLSRNWRDWVWWGLALALTAALLLIFSAQVEAQVGRLVTLDEMRTMPEFQVNGRRQYFGVPPLEFWFAGASGLRFPLFPPIIWAGAVLPWVRWRQHQGRSPLVLSAALTPAVRGLDQLLLAAVGLFLLAHALFPVLYLPSRYTFYSLRFVMAIATGVVLTLVVHRVGLWCQRQQRSAPGWTGANRVKAGLGLGLAIAIVTLPAIPAIFLPCQGWVEGRSPAVYEALAQQPKDSLVASLASEANNVPAFAGRSVLVAEEFAMPYHVEFYQTMLRRMADLVEAQYSSDVAQVQGFIETYGVDVWLLEAGFAEPDYLMNQGWLVNSSVGDRVRLVVDAMRQGRQPALMTRLQDCAIAPNPDAVEANASPWILLDAHCISDPT